MHGALAKTSSRIAIAAALGLMLGGFAFKATPAMAADLGGDCCADLEERVAELEATTVRKGNKKVSVTLSGWVVKSINWWDDGDIDHLVVGDKDYDLGTRFAITGSATISPGWSAGYNITVNTWGSAFGFGSNQFNDLGTPTAAQGDYGAIATLYSYMFIKSDTLGTLNWGHLSPASDNPAVLADISGTVIETNAVFFEGPGFNLRPKGSGAGGLFGLSGLTWGNFLTCTGLGAGIGADCWGAAQPAIRYDSPTWGGFRFETSYGKNQLTGPGITGILTDIPASFAAGEERFADVDTSDTDFWDIAVFYTGDWNSIKLSAAAAYTWIETGVTTMGFDTPFETLNKDGDNVDLFQVGASIMHKPSGLGIYGMYQHEETDAKIFNLFSLVSMVDELGPQSFAIPDTDVWYLKPFWRKAWSPIGATVLYGEYGQYNDQMASLVGLPLNFADLPACPITGADVVCFATGSEVQRWGLGVVQEIDSAAMHLWLRWQHQELDVDIVGFGEAGSACDGGCRVRQGFDDWDVFQAGGVIFF